MIDPSILEQRTEPRYVERVALQVEGKDVNGQLFVEVVLTENISRSGACIKLTRKVMIGQHLQIYTYDGHITKQAIVTSRWAVPDNGHWLVGLSINRPSKIWPNC